MAARKQPFAWAPDRGFFWVFAWLDSETRPPGKVRKVYVGPFDSLDAAWASRAETRNRLAD